MRRISLATIGVCVFYASTSVDAFLIRKDECNEVLLQVRRTIK